MLYDDDEAGHEMAPKMSAALAQHGVRAQWVRPAAEWPGNDLSEWLAGGLPVEDLKHYCEEHGEEPPAESESKTNPIYAGNDDLQRTLTATWAALGLYNDPPKFFRHGGVISQVVTNDDGSPAIRLLRVDTVRNFLSEATMWYRVDLKGNRKPARPPVDIAKAILAVSEPPLPILDRLVAAPVLGPDGEIVTAPGYHAGSRVVYRPTHGFELPPIPETPTQGDIDQARTLILDDLLGDFPLISDADRAHAVALILQPLVRGIIAGPTPLYLVEKTSPGTGAGLLCDVALIVTTGRSAAPMAEGRDEDEWRKRLTAALIDGPTAILIDNLRRRLESSALSAAITASIWQDRLLGTSRIVRLPVTAMFIATANNPSVSSEIARRTVTIRMDAKLDRPWLRERDEFRHPDLRAWVREHRVELVFATLTLIRAWVVAGRPKGSASLGNFEFWAETIGGILDVAAVPGFLANRDQFYERTDVEGEQWRAFTGLWSDEHGEDEVGVADLFKLIDEHDVGFDLGKGNEKSQRTRLGLLLRGVRDRRFGDNRVDFAGAQKRAARWKLVNVVNVVNVLSRAGEKQESVYIKKVEREENVLNVHPEEAGEDVGPGLEKQIVQADAGEFEEFEL